MPNPRPGRKADLPPVHQPPTWLTKHATSSFPLASGFPRIAAHSGQAVPPAARGSLDKSLRHSGPACQAAGTPPPPPPPPEAAHRPHLHRGCHSPAALTPPDPDAWTLKHKPDSPSPAFLPSFPGLKVTASEPAPAPALAPCRSSRFRRVLRFRVWLRVARADALPTR